MIVAAASRLLGAGAPASDRVSRASEMDLDWEMLMTRSVIFFCISGSCFGFLEKQDTNEGNQTESGLGPVRDSRRVMLTSVAAALVDCWRTNSRISDQASSGQ